MKKLSILRFGKIEDYILDYLKENLLKIFNKIFTEIEIIDEIKPIPNDYFNPTRQQYKASFFLYETRNTGIDLNCDRILGITDVDIYAPGLNFIFGQAEFSKSAIDSKACIISITRLNPKFYGIPIDNEKSKNIFLERILKEAIHEIGHTLGLEHCNNYCIMQFSNSLLDTDKKPAYFCDKCAKKIKII